MTETLQNANLPFLHPTTLERPALLDRLGLALQHRVTLIAAHPGYGKTTLVAQFARRSGCPVAWHTVEPNERDLPDLLTHCLEALSNGIPGIETIDLQPGLPAAGAARVIADRLHDLPKPLIYVLDDVHYLLGALRAEQWLQALVTAAPLACHLILIGRALPSLPLMEMVARREILAIGQEQLRFTFDEIQTLADRIGSSTADREFQRLIARLDGWPAGSLLALQPLPSDIEDALFQGRSGPEALFSSLAELMLKTQSEPLQEFLLQSSTLTRFTPALCQEALGLVDTAYRLPKRFSVTSSSHRPRVDSPITRFFESFSSSSFSPVTHSVSPLYITPPPVGTKRIIAWRTPSIISSRRNNWTSRRRWPSALRRRSSRRARPRPSCSGAASFSIWKRRLNARSSAMPAP